MRALFLINPTAGRGRGLTTWKRIEKLVSGNPDYEAVIPASYAETRRVAAEAVRNGLERVVVLGGDGTLDAVACELAGSGTTMGFISCGTGNDFGKTLGVPRAPEAALQVAVGPNVCRVDLGVAADQHHFLNVSGVGFDAEVSAKYRKYPTGLGGTLPYLLGALDTLWTYRPMPLEISVDGERYSGPVTLVAIANGSQYGGGMKIAPTARRDDGVFDVYIADGMSRLEVLGLLPRVYTGAHVRSPKVRLMRGSRVTIKTQGAFHAHIDGDLIDAVDELVFHVKPAALSVAVPSVSGEARR